MDKKKVVPRITHVYVHLTCHWPCSCPRSTRWKQAHPVTGDYELKLTIVYLHTHTKRHWCPQTAYSLGWADIEMHQRAKTIDGAALRQHYRRKSAH